MTAHAPRLPVSLDPLVGEAKRRARRRRVALATLTVAAVAAGLTFGLRVPSGPVAGQDPLSGIWHGTTWRIRAADSGDGRYGMSVLIAGSEVASRSGRF